VATYHGIERLECLCCGWVTNDDETMEIMNDLEGDCPICVTQFFLWSNTNNDQIVTSGEFVRGNRGNSYGMYYLVRGE
jgi:hypothetical protein